MRLRFWLASVGVVGIASVIVHAQIPPAIAARLRTFDTPHYIMHTDISDADAREADLRMTRMFEEYQRRTAGFSGQVNGKFPFFLFKNREDYDASGALKDSDGVFIRDQYGSRLMAIAGDHTTDVTWHIVQHEGFHQFAASVIRAELPIWVNEGLAEYFGEAKWTGDSFVSGLIPPDRLKEVNVAILRKTFKPFGRMMTMTNAEWGSHLDYANYTQAWAMIQFLGHGENGRYQRPFIAFMNNLNRGMIATEAWNSVFGTDTRAFQARFEKWWLAQPANPTREGYVKAAVLTLTSFLARATLQKQTFADVESFVKDVKLPDLKASRDIWLPPGLFDEAKPIVDEVGKWSLQVGVKGTLPKLVIVDEDGTKYVGSFTLSLNRVGAVSVLETPGPKPKSDAVNP
jgi:Protein of unknown function (DUF1570)